VLIKRGVIERPMQSSWVLLDGILGEEGIPEGSFCVQPGNREIEKLRRKAEDQGIAAHHNISDTVFSHSKIIVKPQTSIMFRF